MKRVWESVWPSFPAADENYFGDMDGGRLSPRR